MNEEIKVRIGDDVHQGKFSNMQRVVGYDDHILIEFLARNHEDAACVARIYLPKSSMEKFIEILKENL